ncbi:MAG: serine hydrolase [Firmicutes bacterium]|nr:serine hydrolase [Bacillota bacterium]
MKSTEQDLQRLLDHALATCDATSLSLSCWDGSEVVSCAKGLAVCEKDIAATPDTLYSIGSSTKAFTAASIGILVDRGLLDLDEPVKTYLPDFRMADDYVTEHLTVRDILCHRCGLPRHDISLDFREEDSIEEMVKSLAYLKPAFPFRYRFHYQNHMFILATLLVEKVSGQDFSSFVRDHIFRPLGMDSSYVYGDEIDPDDSRLSAPYDVMDGKVKSVPRTWLKQAAGAGSFYSTTKDMIKWLRFRIHGDEKVLSDRMRLEAQSPQMVIKKGEMQSYSFPEITSSDYGFGWFVESYRGVLTIHHGGALNGYRSMQLFVPEKDIAISALTNSNAIDAVESITYDLLDLLLGLPACDWLGRYRKITLDMRKDYATQLAELQKKKAELAASSSSGEPADYAGIYEHPGYGKLPFTVEGGVLRAHFAGEAYPLFSTGPDQFTLLHEEYLLAQEFTFLRGEDGKVTGFESALEEMLPDEMMHFTRI